MTGPQSVTWKPLTVKII